jgi:hypothetical protein
MEHEEKTTVALSNGDIIFGLKRLLGTDIPIMNDWKKNAFNLRMVRA